MSSFHERLSERFNDLPECNNNDQRNKVHELTCPIDFLKNQASSSVMLEAGNHWLKIERKMPISS